MTNQQDFTDRPLTRKYARIERERRFLLQALPSQVDVGSFTRLRDCFVSGTWLRFRWVENPAGQTIIVKLGQKKPDPDAPDDPRRQQMTTIYMDEREASQLSLDGQRSVKRRYKVQEQGWTFCIDVWEQPANGVILAEVECPTDEELEAIHCPDWAVREVTDDPSYSAFVLSGGDSSG